jgi:hypothetical protein
MDKKLLKYVSGIVALLIINIISLKFIFPVMIKKGTTASVVLMGFYGKLFLIGVSIGLMIYFGNKIFKHLKEGRHNEEETRNSTNND